MNRRALLSTIGLAAIAGCSEQADNSGETTSKPEPASFRVEGIESPDSAEVTREFPVTIKVRNTGGSKGQFKSQTTIKGTHKQKFQDISFQVPPGTSVSETIDISYPFVESVKLSLSEPVRE